MIDDQRPRDGGMRSSRRRVQLPRGGLTFLMDLGWGAAGWPLGRRPGRPRPEAGRDPWWAYLLAALEIPLLVGALLVLHRLVGGWIAPVAIVGLAVVALCILGLVVTLKRGSL